MKYYTKYFVLLFAIVGWFLWVIVIWRCQPTYKVTFHSNLYGENWFEFFAFHIIMIWLIFILIKEFRNDTKKT